MASAEVLTVLAEIAVALAGFTGIVVAFRQQGNHEFLPHEYVRLQYMLVAACALLFFALLPFLPHYLGLSHPSAWGVSSGMMCVGLLALAFAGHLQTRRDPVLSKSRWTFSYITGSIAFSVCALANTLGLLSAPGPGLYVACLGWLLFFSASIFVRLILAAAASRTVEKSGSDRENAAQQGTAVDQPQRHPIDP